MKKNEILLNAIGELPDALIQDAAPLKRNKMSRRWKGLAIAACLVVVMGVGGAVALDHFDLSQSLGYPVSHSLEEGNELIQETIGDFTMPEALGELDFYQMNQIFWVDDDVPEGQAQKNSRFESLDFEYRYHFYGPDTPTAPGYELALNCISVCIEDMTHPVWQEYRDYDPETQTFDVTALEENWSYGNSFALTVTEYKGFTIYIGEISGYDSVPVEWPTAHRAVWVDPAHNASFSVTTSYGISTGTDGEFPDEFYEEVIIEDIMPYIEMIIDHCCG